MSTDRRPTGGVNDRENSAPWDGVDSKGSQPPEEYPRRYVCMYVCVFITSQPVDHCSYTYPLLSLHLHRRPVESDLLHDHSDDGRPDQQDQTTIEVSTVCVCVCVPQCVCSVCVRVCVFMKVLVHV
jgi:hypothetical protein